uniref:Uncharacterized protein n=1 Tax=Salmo trutta TaxID=8032 RepID=A0A674BFT4_SALTR
MDGQAGRVSVSSHGWTGRESLVPWMDRQGESRSMDGQAGRVLFHGWTGRESLVPWMDRQGESRPMDGQTGRVSSHGWTGRESLVPWMDRQGKSRPMDGQVGRVSSMVDRQGESRPWWTGREILYCTSPLAEITASSLLGFDATSLAHLYLGSFSHYSLQILSSSVRLNGERRCTAIFRSLERCSTGFKSCHHQSLKNIPTA